MSMKITIEFLHQLNDPKDRVFYLHCNVSDSEVCFRMLQFIISRQLSYHKNMISVREINILEQKTIGKHDDDLQP